MQIDFLLVLMQIVKDFRPDLRVMHVSDLNFVLRLVIFVHFDGKLRASHLILGCTPGYTTW